jgi:magnesium-transporting ATPase (P-type)
MIISDNLSVIPHPSLQICMILSSFYFFRKNISCISDRKMNAAGRVNIIVLDKTGTLTEENL